MPEEVQLPGGKKIPGWVILAGGAVVVLILLMKKGGGGTEEDQGVQGDLLSSEMNQRFQEMQEALQQALDDAAQNPPTDQTVPPIQPVEVDYRPGGDIPIWRTPPTTEPPAGITPRPEPSPGGMTPPPIEPAPIEPAPIPAGSPIDPRPEQPPRPGGGLPPRLTTAPIGTRTAHQSRIQFIEEAGDDAAALHRESRARHEETSPALKMTNITERYQAVTGSRKQEREKKSPALKTRTKTAIIKQAPSTSQKISKKGPTVRTGRKR